MKNTQSIFFAFVVAAIISGIIIPSLWVGLAVSYTDLGATLRHLFDFKTKMPLLLIIIPLSMFASYCVIFHAMYQYFRREAEEPH